MAWTILGFDLQQGAIPSLMFTESPFIGYRGCFSGVKRPGHEVYDSRSSVPGLRISGAVPRLILCAFMAWKGTSLCVFLLCLYMFR